MAAGLNSGAGMSSSEDGYLSDSEEGHDLSDLVKDEDVQKAMGLLAPFVTPSRMDKLQAVLGNRTRHSVFVFENAVNPNK